MATASQLLVRINADTQGLKSGLNSSTQALNNFGRVVGGLKAHFLAVSIASVSAGFAVKKGWDWAAQGAAFNKQHEILDKLASKYKTTADSLIGDMKRVSANQISVADATAVATKSMLLGLTPEKLVELTRVAELYGDAINLSVVEALESMTQAATTGMARSLKQMGIVADLTGAYQKLADQLFTTTDALTEEQRTQAGVNEILRVTRGNMGLLSTSTLGLDDRMEALSVQWRDFKQAMTQNIAVPIAGVAVPALTMLINSLGAVGSGVDSVVTKWGEWIDATQTWKSLNAENAKSSDISPFSKIGHIPGQGLNVPASIVMAREMAQNRAAIADVETLTGNYDGLGRAIAGVNEQYAMQSNASEESAKKAVKGFDETMASLDKFTEQFASVTLDREALAVTSLHKELEEYRKLVDLKMVSMEQFRQFNAASLKKIDEQFKDTFKDANQFAIQAARGMQDAFQNFFFDAMTGRLNDLKSMFRGIEDFIARLVAQMLAQKAATALFGDFGSTGQIGGLLGGLFGKTVGGSALGFSELLTGAKGGVFPGPFIPIHAFQSGGIVTRPTLGLIGEGGQREAIIPLDRAKEFFSNNKETTIINQEIKIYAQDASTFRDFAKRNRNILMDVADSARKDFHPTRRGA